MSRIAFDVGYTGCCGFKELHDFHDTMEEEASWSDFTISIPNLINELRVHYKTGQLFHVWFKKEADFEGKFEDEYEFSEFRDHVRSLPGVVHLDESVNPNSTNMIDGYMFKI